MPGIDGMEVLERVKKKHPRVEIIILTGHGSQKEEEETAKLGAFKYLQKPADTSSIIDTIKSAYAKSLAAAIDYLKHSKEEFDRSITAAAMAQAGAQDIAREMMNEAVSEKKTHSDETASDLKAQTENALKVLLVDDEEDFVRTVAERMEMRELGSDVALTGSEALKMMEDEVPDVMVLDLRMPGIDGMEVLEKVKKTYPSVQVIIMTGHGSQKDEEEARRLGAFDYLQKPVDINLLMETIRKAGMVRQKK